MRKAESGSVCVKNIIHKEKTLAPFREVFVTQAGCTVSSHCGPGTLGVLFLRQPAPAE